MSMHENGRKRHSVRSGQLRSALVVALLLGLSTTALRALARPAQDFVDHLRSGPPAGGWVLYDLVVGAATCLALVAVAALGVSGVTTAVAASSRPTGQPHLGRLAPACYRRLVLIACGSALALPVGSPALAAERDTPSASGPDFPSLSGLPLPDLPTSTFARTPHVHTVRVSAGDSLWSIATRLSGPKAPPARVAAYVDELHALNLNAIGPDPDLIFPGTELTTPGGTR
jgi:hypothetical protein